MVVFNIGQKEKGWRGKKSEVPVLRLEYTLKENAYQARIKVEDGLSSHILEIAQDLDEEKIIALIRSINSYSTNQRFSGTLDSLTKDFAIELTSGLGLTFNGAEQARETYLPYDKKAEVNEDNLKSLDWLIEHAKNQAEKEVDQGSERLLIMNIGGEDFEFLESGDMIFLMNNTPTLKVMDAAIRAGIMTEQDKKDYISLEQEGVLTTQTKEQFKEEGELKGEQKDYRAEDYWAKAPAMYGFDATRQLNYLDIGGEPVMDEFERDYISLLGANVARYDSSVLEVGFGMGISANAVQEEFARVVEKKPGSKPVHIIIEYNHNVAEIAREWGKRQKFPVVVLEGDWQKEIEKIPAGILTGALADPYPLSPEEKHEDAARPLSRIHEKLMPGGVVSYYPDSQYCLSERHAELARQAGFKYIGAITSRFAEEGKNTGKYYNPKLRMAVTALYKDGGTGSSERTKVKASPEEIKELVGKLFIENPKKARKELMEKPF